MEEEQQSINAGIKWIDIVTDWMDNKIRIPGTKIRFGLDFLIGLVPYIGDILSFGISGLLLMGMARHGASGMLLLKMTGNVLLDTIIGSIPILGDLFDLQYRANWRNLKLFEEFYEKGEHQGNGCWVIVLLLFGLIALFGLLIYLIWNLMKSTWNLILS